MSTAVVPVKVIGDDLQDITLISSGNPYKNVTDKEHRFFGKTFRLYTYLGIAFTVNEEHEFNKLRDEDNLRQVTFMPGTRQKKVVDKETQEESEITVDTLEVAGVRSLSKTLINLNAEAEIKSITASNFTPMRRAAVVEEAKAAIDQA